MEFTAEQIAQFLNNAPIVGDAHAKVNNIAPLENATENDLSFLGDEKYCPLLENTKAGIMLISKDIPIPQGAKQTFILVHNARLSVGYLLNLVEQTLRPAKKGIENPSFVSEGVKVPEDAYIGAFAYIGKNVTLGKGVQIYPNSYIGDNVKIGDKTIIYAGAKVYADCKIGERCIIHAGAVIGADGFGFEKNEKGENIKIAQIGTVIIDDDVEIGANTTVDRAMMGATHIKKNTKIDNLVQIAHNVKIGSSSFLCAQVGIAGSTEIGANCILTGQVGVAGHISIPDNCVFGAQSGVRGNIKKAGTYSGSPAIDASDWMKATVIFKQLPEIVKKMK